MSVCLNFWKHYPYSMSIYGWIFYLWVRGTQLQMTYIDFWGSCLWALFWPRSKMELIFFLLSCSQFSIEWFSHTKFDKKNCFRILLGTSWYVFNQYKSNSRFDVLYVHQIYFFVFVCWNLRKSRLLSICWYLGKK